VRMRREESPCNRPRGRRRPRSAYREEIEDDNDNEHEHDRGIKGLLPHVALGRSHPTSD